jgi:hypothetical protein
MTWMLGDANNVVNGHGQIPSIIGVVLGAKLFDFSRSGPIGLVSMD